MGAIFRLHHYCPPLPSHTVPTKQKSPHKNQTLHSWIRCNGICPAFLSQLFDRCICSVQDRLGANAEIQIIFGTVYTPLEWVPTGNRGPHECVLVYLTRMSRNIKKEKDISGSNETVSRDYQARHYSSYTEVPDITITIKDTLSPHHFLHCFVSKYSKFE